jgi:hypothetical protein
VASGETLSSASAFAIGAEASVEISDVFAEDEAAAERFFTFDMTHRCDGVRAVDQRRARRLA